MEGLIRAVHRLLLAEGAVDRDMLREELDLSDEEIGAALRAGVLLEPFNGAFVLGPGPVSDWHRLLAASIAAAPGRGCAVISHRSAARFKHLRSVAAPQPEVTVLGTGRIKLPGVHIHRTDSIAELDVVSIEGGRFKVTSVAKTMFDLGAVVSPDALERAFEDAFFRGLVDGEQCKDVLARNRGRGRRGAAAFNTILEARDPDHAPPESELELAMHRFIRRAGIDEPTWQHEVVIDGETVRVDGAWVDRKKGLEANSMRWHSGRADGARNSKKARLLTLADWKILPYSWVDLRHRRKEMEREIRKFLDE